MASVPKTQYAKSGDLVAALSGLNLPLMCCRLAPLLALTLVGCAGHDPNARAADSGGDVRICQSIRSAVLARDVKALTVLDILCKGDLVVIAGALPPDYTLAVAAVHIARNTVGVGRVETFFVPRSEHEASDSTLAAQLRTAVARDDDGATTDLTVVAGTVVLVGVVDDQAKAARLVANLSAVPGVKGVKSFLQVKP